MCEYYMRGLVELSPEPLFGETYVETSVAEDRPRPMYALFESDVPLLPIVKCWPNISIRPLPYRV